MSQLATDAPAGERNPPASRIVVLTAGGALANIVVNGLAARVGPLTVIQEQPEGRSAVLRRRIRLLGVIPALGQVALSVALRLDPRRSARLDHVWRTHGLDPAPENPVVRRYSVPSVNDPACHALLAELRPHVVAVYGTRLLSRRTLGSVPAPFLNYHAGITPKYRGQDPAYWARATGDEAHAGVTIHLVDEGVDTGGVLYQAPVRFAEDDRIDTYQHVQAASALPLFARAIEDALAGRLTPRSVDLPSQKWFPPTLWTYLGHGLARGVW